MIIDLKPEYVACFGDETGAGDLPEPKPGKLCKAAGLALIYMHESWMSFKQVFKQVFPNGSVKDW